MLKKAVQQGRSERESEAYIRSYVEGLSDARTQLGQMRVLGALGWRVRRTGFFYSFQTKKKAVARKSYRLLVQRTRNYLPPGILYFAVQGIKPPSGFLSGVKTS